MRVVRDDPDATMAVMPADHVIGPDESFQRRRSAWPRRWSTRSPRRLVTFGIRPTYPAETFGYIEHGEALPPPAAVRRTTPPVAYRVAQFHEKPKADVPRQYLAAGNFFWNSGIFLWKAQTILDALAAHQPEMFAHLTQIADAAGSPSTTRCSLREFAAIEGISIDYAVMEHAAEVVVVEAPFDWDDVGSWRALARLRRPTRRATRRGRAPGHRTTGHDRPRRRRTTWSSRWASTT